MFDIIVGAVVVIAAIVLVLAALVWVVDKAGPVSFRNDDFFIEEDFVTTEDDFPEFWERDGSWYVRATDSGYEYNPDFKE